MKTFRCPVDDLVFDTTTVHTAPHHTDGHIDCPGPACREKHEVKLTPEQKLQLQITAADNARKQAAEAARIAEESHRSLLLELEKQQQGGKSIGSTGMVDGKQERSNVPLSVSGLNITPPPANATVPVFPTVQTVVPGVTPPPLV